MTTTMSNDLDPLGGLLDSLLERLAVLEKFADAQPAQKSPNSSAVNFDNIINTTTNTNGNDSAQHHIESLQSEVANLRTQLDVSEKKCQRLELQLANAGIKVAEDIPYEVAKAKVQSIAKRMQEIGSANIEVEGDKDQQKRLREEYYVLELEMEKYHNALCISSEYLEEGKSKERQWEKNIKDDNKLALAAIRRHMPVDIKNMTESQITSDVSPNGKILPTNIAKKFKRCNVLQLLRMDPTAIARSHPASLENYRVNGMTLTERRALYSHLTDSKTESGMTIAETWAKNQKKDEMVNRKYIWYNMMRDNLKSTLTLYDTHVDQCGPVENHECTLIGNQCPLRADRNLINYYKADYGYPDGDVYVQLEKAATISLSAAPEKMTDPTQLSEDRVKEEIKNRKRLAYQDWKKTHEQEYKSYTEKRAVQQVQMEELEKQIKECKEEEAEKTIEHKRLKSQLSSLPRGSKDRLPTMKKVNVCQTQRADAKRRSEAAVQELEQLKIQLEEDKEFVCSVPKPEWDENGNSNGIDDTVEKTANLSQHPSSDNGEMNMRRLSLRNVNAHVDSNRRYSTSVVPGGSGVVGGRRSPKAGLLAAIQSRGLKQVDEDIAKATPQSSSTDKTKEPSSTTEKDEPKSTKAIQDGQYDTFKTVVTKGSALESTKDTDLDIAKDTRKSSKEENTTKENDYVISSYGNVSQQSQTYKRKQSAGQPVNRTTLLSCPPPKENNLKNVAEENARKQEEADKVKKAAMEKARAEAKERAERLRKEKEERELKEAREREEAEQKERQRQDLLAKQLEEEETKRRLAREAEQKRAEEEERKQKEEQDRIRNDQVAQLEQRIKECEEEAKELEEMMQQCKKELKDMPRGSKDRLAKMKQINMYQQKRGEVRIALDAAKEELHQALGSK